MSKPHLIVIGAGSGGLTAAIGAVKAGYEVSIIEKSYIGGDCTNYGCVPSKALISRAGQLATMGGFAVDMLDNLDPAKIEKLWKNKGVEILQEVRETREKFREEESQEWIESLGINFIKGTAKFKSETEILVENLEGDFEKVEFDYCVIATGSKPFIPNIDGLRDLEYLTNENIFELKEVPSTMAILGAGAIAIELAQAFTDLGTAVTIFTRSGNILKNVDQVIANNTKVRMETSGVRFLTAEVEQIIKPGKNFEILTSNNSELSFEQLLVATGRKANFEELDLGKAGIEYDKDGIVVDKYARATQKNIFAIGDCISSPLMFTHFADYMASKVVTNLAVKKYTRIKALNFGKISTDNIPSSVFTRPEIAQIGLTPEQAVEEYGESKIKIYSKDLSSLERAKIEGEIDAGVIRIVTKGFWGKMIGVSIEHQRAGEMLPYFQTLVSRKKTIWSLMSLTLSYPTHLFGIDSLAKEWLFENVLGRFMKKNKK